MATAILNVGGWSMTESEVMDDPEDTRHGDSTEIDDEVDASRREVTDTCGGSRWCKSHITVMIVSNTQGVRTAARERKGGNR